MEEIEERGGGFFVLFDLFPVMKFLEKDILCMVGKVMKISSVFLITNNNLSLCNS